MKLTALVVLVGILAAPAGASSITHASAQAVQEAKFFVTGFVKAPGAYQFKSETMTVGDAIEAAGGFSRQGNHRMTVSRKVNGERREFFAAFDDEIQPNDTVRVE